ncbi:MAG: response regulator [Candidatus Firestonebacteria bacterium]|nr:response regulator [Candidatus Firestonebacteria bacterium]
MLKEKILIVEDDVEFCDLLAEALREEGFVVAQTNDPIKGKALLEKGSFAAVLLDYKMPGLNGTELVKKIKSEGRSMKVFIISGRPFIDKILETEGLTELVTAVIPKPVDFDLLLKKLRNMK